MSDTTVYTFFIGASETLVSYVKIPLTDDQVFSWSVKDTGKASVCCEYDNIHSLNGGDIESLISEVGNQNVLFQTERVRDEHVLYTLPRTDGSVDILAEMFNVHLKLDPVSRKDAYSTMTAFVGSDGTKGDFWTGQVLRSMANDTGIHKAWK